MDNSTTEQKIERLEKELADLREKARTEKEEADAKTRAERDADFRALEKQVKDFNQKYDEKVVLSIGKDSPLGEYILDGLFPFMRYFER